MSHYAFRERGDDLAIEVDVVVIGSGAGGATAAASLARHGLHVAIVEAGAWRDPEHYPSSTYGGLRDLMPDTGAQVATGRALWPIVQGRVVGGSTVVNSAICVRTPADIFDLWKTEHGVGGDRLRERIWGYQDELESELCAEPSPEQTWGRSNELAMAGAQKLGMKSHPTTRYVKGCLGSGQCLQGCGAQRKQSLNLNFVPEVIERGGTVVSCAPVNHVLIENGRATGVVGHFQHPNTQRWGAAFTVRARKAVVVAASAVMTPILLKRSGVRHPALGEYFRAHPGAGVFGCYDEPVDQNRGATQGWATMQYRLDPGVKLETLSLQLGMVASRLGGGGRRLMQRLAEYRHLAMWVVAVRAQTVGRVKRGLFGPMVFYNMSKPDMERLRFGFHKVAQIHVAAGAQAVLPGIAGMPYKLDKDEIDKLLEAPLDPRCYIGILSHLFGGAVFGGDEATSVCDHQGRVRGVESLIVSDASGIPSTLGVNPQHTIMALSRLRADQLVGEAE